MTACGGRADESAVRCRGFPAGRRRIRDGVGDVLRRLELGRRERRGIRRLVREVAFGRFCAFLTVFFNRLTPPTPFLGLPVRFIDGYS